MKSFLLSATAALALAAFSPPAQALDLGGALGGGSSGSHDSDNGSSDGGHSDSKSGLSVSVDRDGVSVGVGKTEANVSIGDKDKNGDRSLVGIDVNGPAETKANIDVLSRDGVISGKAKSDLVGGINAKLEVLSTKNLAKICVNVGGGKGCGSGDRSELLGLIQAQLEALSPNTLASLCLSVGGTGCGGGGFGGPGGPGDGDGGDDDGPGGPSGGPGDLPDEISDLSDHDRAIMKKRCVDIINRRQAYDPGLYDLCRLLAQL